MDSRRSPRRRLTLGVIAAAVLLAAIGAGSSSLVDRLRSTAAAYYAKAGQIALLTGRDSTMDYYQRLLDDADRLTESQPETRQRQAAEASAQLDLSLALQLLSNSYQPMAWLRGPGETFVRASKDGTMQPVAVYVPRRYTQGTQAPLVVFLHGRLEPESQLVAPEFIEEVAFAIDPRKRYLAGYSMGGFPFSTSARSIRPIGRH